MSISIILGWSKSSFAYWIETLLHKPNEHFGKPNTLNEEVTFVFCLVLEWCINQVACNFSPIQEDTQNRHY